MMAQGVDSSTCLSAYMARGCLSPRTVYKAAVALARDTAADEATCKGAACLIMHLQIRLPPYSSCEYWAVQYPAIPAYN